MYKVTHAIDNSIIYFVGTEYEKYIHEIARGYLYFEYGF